MKKCLGNGFTKELEIVSTFLEADVKDNADAILKNIEDVVNGKHDGLQIKAYFTRLELTKYTTHVFSNIAEDRMENWCHLDREDLKDIIILWGDKHASVNKEVCK